MLATPVDGTYIYDDDGNAVGFERAKFIYDFNGRLIGQIRL
jgi:hypothetical protein